MNVELAIKLIENKERIRKLVEYGVYLSYTNKGKDFVIFYTGGGEIEGELVEHHKNPLDITENTTVLTRIEPSDPATCTEEEVKAKTVRIMDHIFDNINK